MKRYVAYGLLLTVSLVFAIFLIVDWRQYETGLEQAIKPADKNYENSKNYVSDKRMINVIVKLTEESPATFGTRLKSAQRIDERRVHVNTNKLEGIYRVKGYRRQDFSVACTRRHLKSFNYGKQELG